MNAVATAASSPLQDSMQAAFAALRDESAAVSAVRQHAFDQFLSQGFPSVREEAWKYTTLRRFESAIFTAHGAEPVTIPTLAALPDVYRAVFIDGRFNAALSSLPTSKGVAIRALSSLLNDDAGAEALARTMSMPTRLAALNAALCTDGIVIELERHAQLDRPLCLTFAWTHKEVARGDVPLMTHPRILVRLGKQAQLHLIEQYLGDGSAACFTNVVTLVDLASGAQLQHERLQQENAATLHVGALHAQLSQDATLTTRAFNMGGQLSRLDIHAVLQGANAEIVMDGLQFATGNQHHDTHTVVSHAVPNTRSTEDYRGIADQRGRVVFNGKVIVQEHARGTDAKQSSRNLLLSKQAEIDTKPELEIYNDDVKCAHGATIGQLDATAIFYLRSRGLGEAEARALLTHAFADQLISRLSVDSLRQNVTDAVHSRFQGPLFQDRMEVQP